MLKLIIIMGKIKKWVLPIFVVYFLLLPIFSEAIDLNLNYPEFGGFDLNEDQNLNQMVAWFYYFIVTIAGVSAFFTLILGGFEWLTSTGDPSKISNAKDKLSSALLGLVIILASYLILQVVNPELTTLNLPSLTP